MKKVLRMVPGAIKIPATAFARMDGIVGPLVCGIMIHHGLVNVHMVSLEIDNCDYQLSGLPFAMNHLEELREV